MPGQGQEGTVGLGGSPAPTEGMDASWSPLASRSPMSPLPCRGSHGHTSLAGGDEVLERQSLWQWGDVLWRQVHGVMQHRAPRWDMGATESRELQGQRQLLSTPLTEGLVPAPWFWWDQMPQHCHGPEPCPAVPGAAGPWC